jgi:hypothetical protein
MQKFVNGLVTQCARHKLSAELIIVEWNPPFDRPPLIEELKWPASLGTCDIRIVTVPAIRHKRCAHADKLPLYQMIAKNVGIRRARGKFVVATNIDIIFSDSVICYLRDKLEPAFLYRNDRCDVPSELPETASFDQVLRFCEREAFRINANGHTYVRDGEKWATLDKVEGRLDPRVRFLRQWLIKRIVHFPGGLRARLALAMTRIRSLLSTTARRTWLAAPAQKVVAGFLGSLESAVEFAHRVALAATALQGAVGRFLLGDAERAGQITRKFVPRVLHKLLSALARFRKAFATERRASGRTVPAIVATFAKGAEKAWTRLSLCAYGIQEFMRPRRRRDIFPMSLNGRRGLVLRYLGWFVRAQLSLKDLALLSRGRKAVQVAGELTYMVFSAPLTLLAALYRAMRLCGFALRAKLARCPANVRCWMNQLSSDRWLFTNACGDFTLLSRDDWFKLRGYPEWEIFSWHIDSVLLYQANRNGIQERYMGSKARIYHIEHGKGSGYTPEGANDLFARLDTIGLPYLSWPDFVALVMEMDETKAGKQPVIYNSENWGFADEDLPETDVATFSRRAALHEKVNQKPAVAA